MNKHEGDAPRGHTHKLPLSLLTDAPIGIYIAQDGRFCLVNPLFEQLTGYNQDELLGVEALSLVFPDDRETVRGLAIGMLQGRSSIPYEFRIVNKRGETRWIMEAVASIDYRGRRATLGCFMTDVTERKQAEDALRLSERNYHAIFDSANDAIFVHDLETGAILDVNHKMTEMYGYTRREARDLTVEDLSASVHPFTQGDAMEWLRKAIAGEPQVFEWLAKDKAGQLFWVEVNIKRAALDGKPRLLAIVRDISERKQAEEQLRRAYRAYRVLSECNQNLVRASEEQELLNAICRTIVEEGGYRLAWVGLALNDDAKTVQPMAQAGYEEGYLDSVKVTWGDDPWAQGPAGRAIRTGKPEVVRDILTDPGFALWRPEASARGYASVLGLPLISSGQAFGALTIYAVEPDAFDAEEMRLLGELADDLAYGLVALRTRVSHIQMQEALLVAAQQWRTTFDTMTSPIALLNGQGMVVRCNKAASEFAGKPFHAMLGRPCWRAMHDLPSPPQGCPFPHVLEAKSRETCMLSLDGRFYEETVDPILDEAGEVIGAVHIMNDVTERRQAEQKLEQSLEQLQRAMDATIRAMAMTVEMRDPYTAGHQRRVAELGRAIAAEMRLPDALVQGVYMASMIHDIGKISVPAEVLAKPASLTNAERSIITPHPEIGYDILRNIDFPWPIADVVRQHHERMDGSGYPAGLSGDGIRVEARILAVADVVEAMSSHRPYRPALGVDAALEEVSRNRGALYDADAADACLKLFREGRFSFEESLPRFS